MQVENYHHEALSEEADTTAQWAGKAREYLALAEQTVEHMSSLLDQQRDAAEATMQSALETQRVELAVDSSALANRERVDRNAEVDSV